MTVRVQKWGNSLAVRIPRAFAAEALLEENMPVDMSVEDGNLIVRPRVRPRRPVEELVAQITDDNMHDPVDWGSPVGKEVW